MEKNHQVVECLEIKLQLSEETDGVGARDC